jgi:hypothetical protein
MLRTQDDSRMQRAQEELEGDGFQANGTNGIGRGLDREKSNHFTPITSAYRWGYIKVALCVLCHNVETQEPREKCTCDKRLRDNGYGIVNDP